MLKQVTNPEHGKIRFGYDPLGRRVFKETKKKRTNWLWDGNVPLHEWESHSTESLINVVTWIFEGGFVPCAKVTQDKSYSIVTDYLGTPTQMFDNEGSNVWDMELDIYGKVRTFKGSSLNDCPFRYQGQYLDQETGLYYNRFRYYDPEVGSYISQDPIGLAGSNPTLYGYVHDPNGWLDAFGLAKNTIEVGTTVALTDVENRGVHVNVYDGVDRIHVEIIGEPALDAKGDVIPDKYTLRYEPADPTAKAIKEKESSRWKKISNAVDEYATSKKGSKKLASIADSAHKNYPKNTRNFDVTSKALKQH